MKQPVLLIIICFLISCNNESETAQIETVNNDSVSNKQSLRRVYDSAVPRDIWLDSISNIDFVKKSNAYIDSFSNHQHGIAYLQDTATNGEITIAAGYNGDLRFETYYSFIIDSVGKDFKVLDPVSGKKLSVEAFRKSLK